MHKLLPSIHHSDPDTEIRPIWNIPRSYSQYNLGLLSIKCNWDGLLKIDHYLIKGHEPIMPYQVGSVEVHP